MKESAEVNGIARFLLKNCVTEQSGALHEAICELLATHEASVSNGIMALLWTAIHALKSSVTLGDGARLSRKDAERILIAIMGGPEPTTLEEVAPESASPLNSPGGSS